MSIAEKLVTIAENEQRVYAAGHQAGVDSIPLDQVTAGATDVVSGKTIVAADGSLVEGTADLLAVARSIADRTITEYSDDELTLVGSNVFMKCTALTEVTLPNVDIVGIQAFSGCTSLRKVDLTKITTIGYMAFSSCNTLDTLVFRGESVVPLGGVSYFSNTPFASGGTGGKVYVPNALIESYKVATNWATLVGYGTCEFVAIEGSEYE